jgi:hypothetical protein
MEQCLGCLPVILDNSAGKGWHRIAAHRLLHNFNSLLYRWIFGISPVWFVIFQRSTWVAVVNNLAELSGCQ